MKKSKLFLSIAVMMMVLLGVGGANAVTIKSIVPANYTSVYVEDDGSAFCTITFSGPARITSAVGYFPRTSYRCQYENMDGTGTYGTVWKLIFPEDYVSFMLKDNVGYVKADVNFSGQDGTSGSEYIQLDLDTDRPLGAEFEVYTETKAPGFLDFFRVGNEVGYIKANNHNVVMDDGSIHNFFEEITITGPGGFEANAVSFDFTNNQTVYFSPAITESGTYTIHFPYRAFNVGIPAPKTEEGEAPPEGDEVYFSIEKDYTFSVTIEEATFMDKARLVNPVSPYLSSIGRFEFSYIGETIHLVNPADVEDEDGHILSTTPLTLTIQDDKAYDVYPYLVYYSPGNPDIDFGTDVATLSDDPSATQLVVVSITSLQERLGYELPYGQYTLGIPAGIFANEEGALNPAQSFEVTLMRSSEWGEVNPPSMDDDWNMYEYDASELEEVTVVWEEGTIAKVFGSQEIIAYPEVEGAEPVELLYGKDAEIDSWEENSPLYINLSSLAPGFWNVSIPEGYVTVGGDLINSQQTVSYHIVQTDTNAVIAIPVDNGHNRMYDLNGVKVENPANGLYIKVVDGKATKVIIK